MIVIDWYNNLQIRFKLLLGFGLVLVLMVVLALVAYRAQQDSQANFNHFLSHDIAITDLSQSSYRAMLEARSAEKNYFLRYQDEGFEAARANYVTVVENQVDIIEANIESLEDLFDSEADFLVNFTTIELNVADYEGLFLEMVALLEARGHKDEGLIGDFRGQVHLVEEAITAQELDELTIHMLMMRRFEKDYLLRGEVDDVRDLQARVVAFKQDLAETSVSEAEQENLVTLVDDYQRLFEQVVATDEEIANKQEEVERAVDELEPLLNSLYERGEKNREEAQAELEGLLRSALLVIVVVTVGAVVVGLGWANYTAGAFSRVIGQAVGVAGDIAEGRLGQELNVTQKDELGELALAFNRMIGYQRGMAKVARRLAIGDTNQMVAPHSEADELGQAFKQMVQYQQTISVAAKQVAQNNLDVQVQPVSEEDILGHAFREMIDNLKALTASNEKQIWLAQGKTSLHDGMRGQQTVMMLAQNVIRQLCQYLDAPVGTIYLKEDDAYHLVGSYAYVRRKNVSGVVAAGEGLVGQAILEKSPIVISNIPDDYIKVSSGLGETAPQQIVALPLVYEEAVLGALELGTLGDFSDVHLDFLVGVAENVAIALHAAQAREQVQALLEQTQQQAEEMQTQQEELRVTNEELTTQTEQLRISEQRLREQQTELEATNAELEESALALQQKQEALNKQNEALQLVRIELERRAEELALASKYKSEFLANMSHELRTPLNSLLILANMLAKNDEGNLSPDQVESAQIIYQGGQDLLSLINEILDLAKVESGKMSFQIEPVVIEDLVLVIENQFGPLASQSELEFELEVADDMPEQIVTDRKRVLQIVKNLLSNAFKFTSEGSVSCRLGRAEVADLLPDYKGKEMVAVRVRDTGIGMTAEQQKVVFEAFQQADGSTSRQYGGTGLGLSISRELAEKLGGYISLESEEGKGSVFTLYLPLTAPTMGGGKEDGGERLVRLIEGEGRMKVEEPKIEVRKRREEEEKGETAVATKRSVTLPTNFDNKKGLLIIEDDPHFATILQRFAREKGFVPIHVDDGLKGLQVAQEIVPAAIILDINLPQMSGWEVLENLKQDTRTRHIPIHIMSVYDVTTLEAQRRGAIGFLAKPVAEDALEDTFGSINKHLQGDLRALLLVEDDAGLRRSVTKLLEGDDVEIVSVGTGEKALAQLRERSFDCMVLDLNLPDMTGFDLLHTMHEQAGIEICPVIIYTGRELTRKENQQLMKYVDSIIVKGVKSPERLLDETALFLHRVVDDMPREQQNAIKKLYKQEMSFENRTVLIVDDDMRNSFALSKLLADYGLKIEIANNGQKALDMLAKGMAFDIILMDIMMPVMDGLETIKQIRQDPTHRKIPILALTAKAMKGDREACLEAGANDYLSKPIDTDRLLSMLRVWLYNRS
ncbi:MAG TPA: response regulator [Anaerolineae bacterium]|nr:response regulator [Anaerolineae bacterium]